MSVFALESLVPDKKNDTNWSYFPEPTKQKLEIAGGADLFGKHKAWLETSSPRVGWIPAALGA